MFESYEQLPDRFVARFHDASSFACDVLIGADGLHSRARNQLLHDGEPTERGYVAWRGVLSYASDAVALATATEIYGRGRRFGIGPLGADKVGWWASANRNLLPDGGRSLAGNADHELIREELLQLFHGWCEPVPDLIRATAPEALVRNHVFDRQSVRKWGEGCMTLIGDAIHPLTPNLGQGGCLAIEDAAVLARCFEKYVPTPTATENSNAAARALRRYENLRFSRTAWVARFSRTYGMFGQLENELAVRTRDLLLSLVPQQLTTNFLRGIFDYDAYAISV